MNQSAWWALIAVGSKTYRIRVKATLKEELDAALEARYGHKDFPMSNLVHRGLCRLVKDLKREATDTNRETVPVAQAGAGRVEP
jgi:hypothetical protein